MRDGDRPVTRGEVIEMFSRSSEVILGAVLDLLGVPGAAAVRKARLQDDELRRVDPVFADQRDAVREAMAKGAHITLGDPGFRKSVADVPLAKIANADRDDDADAEVGPKLREIRARARRRRGEE